MGKVTNDAVYDAALDKIATGNILTVCSAEPSNRTEAVSTYALADVALTPGNGNGDYVISNGDISGRKVRIAQQTDIDIDTSGTATHVAICDDSIVLEVTTCTSQALTSGGTVTVPAYDSEFTDPT